MDGTCPAGLKKRNRWGFHHFFYLIAGDNHGCAPGLSPECHHRRGKLRFGQPGTVLKENIRGWERASSKILRHQFRHPFFPRSSGKLFYAVLLANNSKIINNVTKDCYIGLYKEAI
jgi:hypothetical protein